MNEAGTVIDSGAEFSDCKKYRYTLWRRWSSGPVVMFIGLNPSTADETNDDPTIRRCIGFAKRWGFGGMFMMNAYAFRATLPKDMKRQKDPVGPGNDAAILRVSRLANLIVGAWGVHCETSRESRVCEIVGCNVFCLGKTKGGRPRHPLYLNSLTQLEVFRASAQ